MGQLTHPSPSDDTLGGGNDMQEEIFFCACGCRIPVHFRMTLKKMPWQIRKPTLCKDHKELHKEALRVDKMQRKLEEMIRRIR